MIRLLPLALLLAWPAAAFAQQPLRTPPSRPIDVQKIDLDLTVDLKKRSVAGTATLTFKALRDLKTVALDAVDQRVLGVTREGRKLTYAYDGKRLVIDLPLKQRATAEVQVAYRVEDPKAGLYFFGPSKDAPKTPWQVWSQGEDTYNRYWFPCVDHPDERQQTAITARVQSGLTVVSNGKLISKLADKKTGLTAWRFEQRREHVAYLVTLVVGTFDVVHDTPWKGKVPLSYYVPPGRKQDIPRSFARTKDMMTLFTKLTGVEYPWAKYDQVVVEQFSWGGMENTGATTLNERTLHDARAHLDYSSEGLVAHELAHQWYGDLLTCRDWSHLWLNESFATFFALRWREHAQGQAEYEFGVYQAASRGMRAGKWRPILDRRYPSPGTMFDGRAYPKGATVLHMLRRQLGEKAFWAGVQRYTKTHQDKSVETNDLRRALEKVSGHNLERFFYDWVERAGNPVLDVALARDAERGLLTVTITQKQRGEAYVFPAELEFRFGKARVVHAFVVKGKRERFVLPETRKPTLFRFDPREAVALKEVTVRKGRDLWIRQLREGDVVGRVRAAIALGKDGRPQARGALVRGLSSDRFWAVRAECAKALVRFKDAQARDALLAALKGEKHPKARREVVRALGNRGKEASVAKVLAALLEKGDPSYYVQAEAIAAYGKSAKKPKLLLIKQLSKDSHNEVLRQEAIGALRRLEDSSLIPLLSVFVGPANSPRLRQQAARSMTLAALPGTEEEHRELAVKTLREFLRTSGRRGRRAALDGLLGLGSIAQEALTEVELVARLDPQPRLRELANRVAAAIRAGAPPNKQLRRLRKETRRLRQETERLKQKNEALEARIKRLERALLPKKRAKPKQAKK